MDNPLTINVCGACIEDNFIREMSLNSEQSAFEIQILNVDRNR